MNLMIQTSKNTDPSNKTLKPFLSSVFLAEGPKNKANARVFVKILLQRTLTASSQHDSRDHSLRSGCRVNYNFLNPHKQTPQNPAHQILSMNYAHKNHFLKDKNDNEKMFICIVH